MEISTHKVTQHVGCPIYVRRMNTTFEYITVIRNKVYTQAVEFKPTLTGRFMHLVGVWKTKYTRKQLNSSIFYMIAMAEATIETTLNCDETGKKLKKPKVIHITKHDVEEIKQELNS